MRNTENVYWGSLNHQGWLLYAAATAKGLCCITLPNESFERLAEFVERHFPNANLEPNQAVLEPYLTELKEYLEGKRQKFTVPLDLRGTPFQMSVWKSLLQISYGQWATYSDIAASIGRPSAVRAVGAAIGANPVPFVVPCHRVIGKGGKLTGYRGGLDVKSALLKLENVRIPPSP
ncbi:MAG: cysteine methyltransferase [Bacillus thermozeamaize]|uniref:Methylated-DNA--protein-cysteine methyltransferase n=1 Tax=Bacillus thermozeamaize TaxID=230954 RepID=A0A1Y3PU60_9BACI|nr:MAG: cysteine methyltransferase [Bacillus thermozeamaize]